MKAALFCAQSEPGIPILPAQFDADPLLLNCLNGTIDRRTGKLSSHDRTDFITKLAPADYCRLSTSNTWELFLQEATDDDDEPIAFLQPAVGYTLTGCTGEEVLFFVHGPGRTGKSTFLRDLHQTAAGFSP